MNIVKSEVKHCKTCCLAKNTFILDLKYPVDTKLKDRKKKSVKIPKCLSPPQSLSIIFINCRHKLLNE